MPTLSIVTDVVDNIIIIIHIMPERSREEIPCREYFRERGNQQLTLKIGVKGI
jgi:hypothetical protein